MVMITGMLPTQEDKQMTKTVFEFTLTNGKVEVVDYNNLQSTSIARNVYARANGLKKRGDFTVKRLTVPA